MLSRSALIVDSVAKRAASSAVARARSAGRRRLVPADDGRGTVDARRARSSHARRRRVGGIATGASTSSRSTAARSRPASFVFVDLRLHRADAARDVGARARPGLGRRPGRRAGSGLGAELPRRRPYRRAVRRIGRTLRPVRLADGESRAWRERTSSVWRISRQACARSAWSSSWWAGRSRARLRGVPLLVLRAAGGLGARSVKRAAVIAVEVAAAVLVGLAARELWLAVRGESAGARPASAIDVSDERHAERRRIWHAGRRDRRRGRGRTCRRPRLDQAPGRLLALRGRGPPIVERDVTGDTARVCLPLHAPLPARRMRPGGGARSCAVRARARSLPVP